MQALILLAAHSVALTPTTPATFDRAAFLDEPRMQTAAPAQTDAWRHSIALYLLAAGLDGETGVGGVDADVDVSFSDIAENLEFGAMGSYRGENDTLAIVVDAAFMGLGADKERGPLTTKADIDQLIVELDVCWKTSERFEAFVGARYWSLDMDLEITGPGPGVSASGDEDWVDPVVGARYEAPLGEDWSLTLRGDIGGFGVGSDFTWQAIARVNWQFSSAAAFSLGYRVLDVDYENGSGSSEFKYDITTHGMLAGLLFSL